MKWRFDQVGQDVTPGMLPGVTPFRKQITFPSGPSDVKLFLPRGGITCSPGETISKKLIS